MLNRFILCWTAPLILISTLAYADTGTTNTTPQAIVWDYVFSNTQSNQADTTQAWCNTHSPTAMFISDNQLSSKISGINGISIIYNSVFSSTLYGIHFKTIAGTLSGVDAGNNTWSTDIHIYETSLSPTSPINGMWSTTYCKGQFVATPSANNN